MHLSLVQFACAAVLAVTLSSAAPPSTPHHVARRSFFSLECKGVYDAAIFARLDRICDDCYNLFREPQLYTLCRKGCFTSDNFKKCVIELRETDELERFKNYIRIIHRPSDMKDCFTTDYFKGCVEVLQETDKFEIFKQYIRQLHGADPKIS